MRRIPAPLLSLTAVVSWGAMFPIAAHALPHVDAFNLTAIRYGLASLAFVALLVVAEGRGALRYDGRFGELFVLGSFGFAGFNLFTYLGLEHTRPQNAALIVATTPLITALVRWRRDGARPARATLAFMGLALAGVVLVITHGAPGSLVDGGIGGGEALVLLGVIGWVLYTTGVARFPAHSPLRYTTLSAVAGTLTILAVTAVADVAGLQHLPGSSDLRAAAAPLAFIVVFGAVVAVIAYNAGVRRLGAANGALFMNLVPVTTFVIAIAGGTRPGAAELAGALLTIAALVGANLATRRAASTTTAAARERPVPALP
ncbi:MAG: permease of the drug/metabolite transporter superfamily [Solirubrobacterales bacterium]|nr:permease of the drug/metabolite transporter superfamily [Solirubrobacterales bacterium]